MTGALLLVLSGLCPAAWGGPGYMLLFTGPARGEFVGKVGAIELKPNFLQNLTPEGLPPQVLNAVDMAGAIAASLSGVSILSGW